MQSFRVERVDEEFVHLAQGGKPFSIPKSLFAEAPVTGQTVMLAAALHSPDKPVANPLAHDLLNSLLSPS